MNSQIKNTNLRAGEVRIEICFPLKKENKTQGENGKSSSLEKLVHTSCFLELQLGSNVFWVTAPCPTSVCLNDAQNKRETERRAHKEGCIAYSLEVFIL